MIGGYLKLYIKQSELLIKNQALNGSIIGEQPLYKHTQKIVDACKEIVKLYTEEEAFSFQGLQEIEIEVALLGVKQRLLSEDYDVDKLFELGVALNEAFTELSILRKSLVDTENRLEKE